MYDVADNIVCEKYDEERPVLADVYITLFNVPVRVRVRKHDCVEEIVTRFFYQCSRD